MTEQHFSLGLIGFPLGHSLSAHMHQAALQALGLDGEYCLYEVQPLPVGADRLETLLAKMRAGEIDGLNVTIPHKRPVLPYLDALTRTAEGIGAVNTIYPRDGGLTGDNTDAQGFISDLNRSLQGVMPIHPAVVLGAGGAARAAAYALLREGWHVWVASRRLEQAQELAGDLGRAQISQGGTVEALTLADLWTRMSKRRGPDDQNIPVLIVNATPLGMNPDVRSSPWPDDIPWPRDGLVYDLVYNPPETAFMRQARAAGLDALSGLGMLVEQAALAFERWTGKAATREIMQQAALAGLDNAENTEEKDGAERR